MGLQEAIQNIWASDYVQKNPNKAYKVSYADEYTEVAAYLNGGQEPNWSGYSKLGKGLCEAEKERRAAAQPEPPDPPPVSTAYFKEDFVDISNPQWSTIQTYCGNGNSPVGAGVVGDPCGRATMVPAPDGKGRAARFEIRDSDPGWPIQPERDRSQFQASGGATWGGSFAVGEVRWFEYEWYLPNEFDYPRADYYTFTGLHPGNSTGWGCFDLTMDSFASECGMKTPPAWMTFKVAGGAPSSTTYLKYIRLFQLTNADGSPYAPNRNRRIHVVVGGKFAPDNTGWLEIWVDGKNIFPRTNRPTMWTGDSGMYFKLGPYKNKAAKFPSGKTVVYCTKVTIGRDRPF